MLHQLQHMKLSSTLLYSNEAKNQKAAGHTVIDLTVGQPDFWTPDLIKQAGIQAIKNNHTTYTAVGGTPELKAAIQHKLERDNQLQYETEQIIASNGAKQILFLAFQVLLSPGDEVIVPSPAWVSYEQQIQYAGGIIRFVDTSETNCIFTAEQFEQVITPQSKLLIINSPSNPTGAVIPASELEKIAALAVKHNIFVISDEVYEYYVYGNHIHRSIASFGKDIQAQTLTINAVSKAFSMTGWRLGYGAGPHTVIKDMATLQSHLSSNPSSISQVAASMALKHGKTLIQKHVDQYEQRAHKIQRMIASSSLSMIQPDGAFYAWINISTLYSETIKSDVSFSKRLLKTHNVGTIPGSCFGPGGAGYIRVSYAANETEVYEAIQRIILA